jgi:hypothetical protein
VVLNNVILSTPIACILLVIINIFIRLHGHTMKRNTNKFYASLSWSYVKDMSYICTLNMRLVTKKPKQRPGMEETFYETYSNCETLDRNWLVCFWTITSNCSKLCILSETCFPGLNFANKKTGFSVLKARTILQ